MKKSIMLLVIISFLSCRNQTNNNAEKNQKNNLIEKVLQDNTSNLNNLDFGIILMETDEDDRPSQLKIRITRENKISQDIIYSPGIWSVIEDSLIVNQIDYFDSNNTIKEGIENYHNFIIADFNFDNLKDFAILYDEGGNGGPLYSYFFQSKDGKFIEEEKFPLNKSFFPKSINRTDKNLTVTRPQGCCKTNTTIFHFKDGKWQIKSSVI